VTAQAQWQRDPIAKPCGVIARPQDRRVAVTRLDPKTIAVGLPGQESHPA